MKRKQEQKMQTFSQPTPQPKPVQTKAVSKKAPVEFDAWWALFSNRYGVKKHLKSSVEIHMKARGFWEKKDWNAGIRDFGYLAD